MINSPFAQRISILTVYCVLFQTNLISRRHVEVCGNKLNIESNHTVGVYTGIVDTVNGKHMVYKGHVLYTNLLIADLFTSHLILLGGIMRPRPLAYVLLLAPTEGAGQMTAVSVMSRPPALIGWLANKAFFSCLVKTPERQRGGKQCLAVKSSVFWWCEFCIEIPLCAVPLPNGESLTQPSKEQWTPPANWVRTQSVLEPLWVYAAHILLRRDRLPSLCFFRPLLAASLSTRRM